MAIAHGSEEIETMAIIGTLKRAEADVTIGKVMSDEDAGSNDMLVNMSRGVKVTAERAVDHTVNSNDFDAIVLPGGVKGAENFNNNKEFISLLKKHKESGKLLAAICASPALALEPNGKN